MKILVATTNPGKLKEISEMLDFDIGWRSLSDFPDIKEIVEDGKTFAENARKKALGYAKQTGLWTLADDSGLVVDALGGAPGVNSARFSLVVSPATCPEYHRRNTLAGSEPKNRTLLDHKNMTKVLLLLKNIPKEKRTARFVCSLCLASPQKVLIETEGKLEGFIAEKEAGSNGFGYDPVFFVPSLNKTVAQLASTEKNKISHRGNAVKKLKPLLEKLLKTL
jgi:XTP/dITP diphosphohydrolase